jgi:hypothetical protein
LAIITDLHYLPSISYFFPWLDSPAVIIEAQAHFVKQTSLSRCYIRAAQQVERLTVPVSRSGTKQSVSIIPISYRERWPDIHWRSIASAYGKAPYFAFYADAFHGAIYRRHETLFALNSELLTICLQYLNLPSQFAISNTIKRPIPPIFWILGGSNISQVGFRRAHHPIINCLAVNLSTTFPLSTCYSVKAQTQSFICANSNNI